VGYDCSHPIGRLHHILIVLANQNQIVLIHPWLVTGFIYLKSSVTLFCPNTEFSLTWNVMLIIQI